MSELYFHALLGKTCEKKPVLSVLKYVQKWLSQAFVQRNLFAGVTTVVNTWFEIFITVLGDERDQGNQGEGSECCSGSGPGFA